MSWLDVGRPLTSRGDARGKEVDVRARRHDALTAIFAHCMTTV
jgi:hypothetical protein